MTSQDTFEHAFRQRLLDLIYEQWGTLGAPFVDRGPSRQDEVIDPEALLWCSLEFLPTEPRLSEAVSEWLSTNKDYLVRRRVYTIRDRNDPRAFIWEALDQRFLRRSIGNARRLTELQQNLFLPTQVSEFVRSLEKRNLRGGDPTPRLGRLGKGPATLLLKARDLLGQDIRHFLLVYLLANAHGGKLKEIQAWSGYSVRSLFDAAFRWETVNVITLDSGYCRLIASEPFRSLLQIKTESILLVNWLTVFEISIRLLRDLARAREKGFDENSTITKTLQREAAKSLKSSSSNSERVLQSSLGHLLNAFPNIA